MMMSHGSHGMNPGQKKTKDFSNGHIGIVEVEELKQQHQFVRDDDFDEAHYDDWKVRMARKYYDQLYKEFAIIDLSRYEERLIGLRWRTEAEVLRGKGQLTCAARKCETNITLTTFELPFTYQEKDEEKIELVKVILCEACAEKLQRYHSLRDHDQANQEDDDTSKAPKATSSSSTTHSKTSSEKKKKRKQKRDSSSSSSSSSSSDSESESEPSTNNSQQKKHKKGSSTKSKKSKKDSEKEDRRKHKKKSKK